MAEVIENVDDTATNPDPKPEILAPEDGIEDLKRRLAAADATIAAEKARAVEAERRANAASQSAHKAVVDAEDTNLKLIENAIQVSKSNATQFKSAMAEAYRAQDFERVADLQEKMAENQAQLLQLQAGAENMRAKPKQAPPQPIITDPVEALASQVTPKSAAWIRAHPEYARNRAMTDQMVAAHNLAVARGALVDSDNYFYEVERILGIDQREPDEDRQPEPRRSTPAAVPAGRGGSQGNSGANGAGARTYRLTKDESEMARMTGLTDEQYAQNKLHLKREGKLN